MNVYDLAYLVFIAAGLSLDHVILWPRFRREAGVDAGRARRRLWSGWMIMLWTLLAVGVALWWLQRRPWAALRLVPPDGWRLGLAIALIVLVVVVQSGAIVRMARLPADRPVRFGSRDNHLAQMLPHTRGQLASFMALSLTAGVCEEFIFRGYLLWVLQGWLGPWGAAAVSSVAFGLGHAYQGKRGVLATSLVGALLATLVLVTRSLWPAILVHALLDIGQGWIAWLVLRRAGGAGGAAQDPASNAQAAGHD